MSMAPDVEIAVDASPGPASAVSWGAIVAGTAIAAGLTLLLTILGAGLGLSVISPWAGAGVSGATFAMAGIIWLVVTQWFSSAAGGYVAGRLRTRRTDIPTEESFFRDTAHGLATWATATIVVAVIAGMAAWSAVGAGTQAVATAVSGVAQGAGQAASALGDPTQYFTDTLFRTAPGASATGQATAPAGTATTAAPTAATAAVAPAASTAAATANPAAGDEARSEAARILVHGFAATEFPTADKDYLAEIVAINTGLGPDEAKARVDEVIGAMNTAKTEAQAAADAARKAAATVSYLSALALVIGAFIASVAAAIGGHDREAPYSTWRPGTVSMRRTETSAALRG